MTLSCHSPSLIPSPDSLYPKSESYIRVKRGKRSWRNGKRSTLKKMRSEVVTVKLVVVKEGTADAAPSFIMLLTL